MELSMKDKKAAREIIQKGLQIEFGQSLAQYTSILKEWESNPENNQAVYHKLFKKIMKFDKHISQRYDRMTGSKYLLILAAQFFDGVITKEDLIPLSDDAKLEIERIVTI